MQSAGVWCQVYLGNPIWGVYVAQPESRRSFQGSRSGFRTHRRPLESNRRKRCSKPSAATSMGLRSRTSNRADERICHSHPPFTAEHSNRASSSNPERWCTTADLLCSALAALIARPIPHRSFQFSRPPFFCRSFFWALLQANSCARQLRGFCFPGSVLKTL